jgi:hypothetical protein
VFYLHGICCIILNKAFFVYLKLREDVQRLESASREQQNKIAGNLEFSEYFRHLVLEVGWATCIEFGLIPIAIHKD